MSSYPGRDGDALLVVDVQVGVMAECLHPQHTVGVIADLVGRARIAGTPVVWVRHQSPELPAGSPAWQIVPELIPEAGEQVVEKRYGDAFAETELDDLLGAAGADHLWLVGAQSDFCIRSTLFGALYRGYDVTLVEDGHTTADASYDTHLFKAGELVALVNKLAWTTRLPQVLSRVAPAAEVEFAPADRMDDDDKIEVLELDDQADEDADDAELGLADPEPPA